MGEVHGDFATGVNFAGQEEEGRVHEWEDGLPNVDDLTPLTQGLIPPELLSAFNIKPEPYRTTGDVTRASEDTLSALRGFNFKPFDENHNQEDGIAGEIDDEDDDYDEGGSDLKKARRNGSSSPEDADSAAAAAATAGGKTLKRPRLVWTPQLHKRFVEVVAHLGIKNAVPKTIMQLMNVEGLTRENVASHLQKYRLYLKRMHGGSFEGPSNSSASSEKLCPERAPENGNGKVPVSVPYGPQMVPMPMMGMGNGHMVMGNYNGFEASHHTNHYNHHNHNHNHHHHHHQYNMMMMPYTHHPPSHVAPSNK